MRRFSTLPLLLPALFLLLSAPAPRAQEMSEETLNDFLSIIQLFQNQPDEGEFGSTPEFLAAKDNWSRQMLDETGSFVAKHPASDQTAQVFFFHVGLLESGDFTDEEAEERVAALRARTADTPAASLFELRDLMKDESLAAAERLAAHKALAAKYPSQPAMSEFLVQYVLYGDLGGEDKLAAMREIAAMEGLDPRMAAMIEGQLERMEKIGKPFAFSFTNLAGEQVSSETLAGKVVLIDFWATWCGPCVAEMPRLKEFYAEHHDAGFEIVGISLDQDREALATFVDEEGIAWPQWYDGPQGAQHDFANAWGITAIPTMFLVDRAGNLRSVEARSEMETMVPILLAEEAPAKG